MNERFSKFLSYFKPYRRLLIADIACAMVSAGIALLIPLGIRDITGRLIQGGEQDAIYMAGLGLAALTLLQIGCNFFYDYKGHAMGAMMERDMRQELFAHYQKMPFGFFDERRVGKLMSALTNDLLELAELYHHAPEDLVIYLVKFVGALLILLQINAPLTLVMLLFVPICGAFTVIVGKRLHKAFKVSLECIADVQARAEESLSGIRTVQAFGNQPAEIGKFNGENEQYKESRCAIYRSEAVFYNGVLLMGQLLTIAIAVFGGTAILGRTLALNDLIAFLLYANYLIEPMTQLSRVIAQYQEGIAGFNRFADALEIQPAIQDAPHAVELPGPRGEVCFEGVSFRYKEELEHVLRDVSLTVRPGETVAVVGHSGAGKTTLCALIPRFYDVSAGRVLVDGLDVRRIKLSSLRGCVGVVQQDTYLFTGSAMDNIRYGRPDATDDQVIAAAKAAYAHDFIMQLPNGYLTDIGYKGVKLSGGQKQRISIARAFLKDPKILILDEATSALDADSERMVQDSLRRLSQDRTTFIIAHRPSTIALASRVFELSDDGVRERPSAACFSLEKEK